VPTVLNCIDKLSEPQEEGFELLIFDPNCPYNNDHPVVGEMLQIFLVTESQTVPFI
jgi:hypothetical protein